MSDFPNPYVGPYAFTAEDKLHGRDREVRQLLDLLVADRIVLLHSPSGAGKTSLINAALVPALKEDGFHVLNTVRVGAVHEIPNSDGHNRYVLSTLLSLEEGLPAGEQLSEAQLVTINLKDYITRLFKTRHELETAVIVFDQFEEVLTLDPIDEAEKQEFFRQLGVALDERRLWALFSMREDFLGALEPYLRYLPTRLSKTYRLDLLGVKSALAAIRNPALAHQVQFPKNAAQMLVDDLRKVHVLRFGKTVEDFGLHVEPVQLQVVCHRLWSKVVESWTNSQTFPEITATHIANCANVDQALAGYYADKVKEISNDPGHTVRERDLRDWFENNLISEKGIRGQVMQDEEITQGLENQTIGRLVNAYLVREESRRGVSWFELAHDRLIDPIRQDNSSWREANLDGVQIQASAWKKSNEEQSLLPDRPALDEALGWLAEHQAELTATEIRFRTACAVKLEAQQHAEKELRLKRKERVLKARKKQKQIRSRRVWQLAISITLGSVILAVFAVIGGIYAKLARDAGDRTNRVITARQIATEAIGNLDSNPERSLFQALLSTGETYHLETGALSNDNLKMAIADSQERAKDALSQALNDSQGRYTFTTDASQQQRSTAIDVNRRTGISDIAFSPDGNRLLGISLEGMKIWDTVAGSAIESPVCNAITGRLIYFRSDGKGFAVVAETIVAEKGNAISIKFFDGNSCQETSQAVVFPPNKISAMALSLADPQHPLLATGDDGGETQLFDAQTGQQRQGFKWQQPEKLAKATTPPKPPAVTSIAFSADGAFLAAGFDDFGSTVWHVADGKSHVLEEKDKVTGIAFSPDSKFLVTTSGNKVITWDTQTWQPQAKPLLNHLNTINAVAFGPTTGQAHFFATVSDDKRLILWKAEAGGAAQVFATLYGHERSVTKVAFSPDGKYIATASDDLTVRIWYPTRAQNSVTDVAFSADGEHIASLSEDGTVNARSTDSLQQATFSIPESLRRGSASAVDFSRETFKQIIFDPDVPTNVTVVGKDQATPWDFENAQERPFLYRHPGITCIAYGKKDNRTIVATANAMGEVKFWDAKTAGGFFPIPSSNTYEPSQMSTPINSMVFSPDGGYLATASSDGTAKLIVVGTRMVVESFGNVSKSGLSAIAFSPDGHLIATGGDDGLLRIWQRDSKTDSAWCPPIKGHSSRINAVVFIPLLDGLLVASGGGDKQIRVLNVCALRQRKGDDGVRTQICPGDFPQPERDPVYRTYTEKESAPEGVQLRRNGISGLAVNISQDKEFARLAAGTEFGRVRVHFVGKGGLERLLTQARHRANRGWLRDSNCPADFKDRCHTAQRTLELVIEGNEFARTGRIPEAVAKYKEANKEGYEVVNISDPQKEAEELADEGHRERGLNYERSEDWDAALQEYSQLNQWENLFDVGQNLASRGYRNDREIEPKLVDAAIDLYRLGEKKVGSSDSGDSTTHARYDNSLCWYGSWWGYYRPEIEKACDDAVTLSHTDLDYVDSQGVFFALAFQCTKNEDYRKKAIDNFRSYAASVEVKEEKDNRDEWIRRLNNHESIFTPEFIRRSLGGPLTSDQLAWLKGACDRVKQ